MNLWITGGSSGIGLALARHYALAGHQVTISARPGPRLEQAMAQLGPLGVHVAPLDVTDEAAVSATVVEIEETRGPIDLAILNAGTYEPLSAADFSSEAARRLMNVNYFSVCHALQALLPRFRARRRGQLAVMASIAGYRGLPYAGVYSAAKSAVIRLCESLHPELGTAGVQLSVINPGFVKTPLTDRNDFPMPFLVTAEEAAAKIAEGIAAGNFEIRFPRRMAWLMAFLTHLPYSAWFGLTRRMLRSH